MAQSITLERTSSGTPVWITGDGPPVILIHGVLMDHRMWDRQVLELSNHYRVYRIDMLGHGDAPAPPRKPSLNDFVGQVEEVVETFCPGEAPVIGGFSMGGLVTQAYGITHHKRVGGLVILNAVYDRTAEESAIVQARSKMMASEGVEAAISAARKRWFRAEEFEAQGTLIDEICDWMRHGDFTIKCKAHWVFATSDDQTVGRLGEITCPTLIMTGDGDAGSPPHMSVAMASAIHDTELHIFGRQQHMMPVLDATRVNQVLRSFINRVTSN